ncbi:MAG: DUF4974 domain-containing protein [Bacteroidales bacterium]|nr:DUF4974 domain-containing protein [Bacteroidales bacterium]MDD2426060.1 DUF4974 domain-containing protein [Bacteroidales bacterium]MDD3990050.1 DUF4974 domain-containing protein [Bacteroidales bacterium]MDD4638321.1 DUF4974 domain-containing protein [Bacteroidales bacterium]
MGRNIDTELLLKFISGNASEPERTIVLDWISESEENGRIYGRLKNYWVAERYKTFENSTGHPVCMDQTRRESVNPLPGKKRTIRLRSIRLRPILLFAASIALILTTYALSIMLRKERVMPEQTMARFEYIVNPGVKGVVDLPDGSRVWLNSSSSLKCPEKFDSLARVVELDGEGFFEVLPNKEWPMYVKTSKGYGIKVTGTSFNLSSYSDDNKMVVTLISGSISVVHEENKSEIKLYPDEQITITEKERPVLVKRANVEYNTAWKKGYLLFDNTPMEEVIRKMERWYGVNVTLTDSSILDYRFTANFRSESISRVLEILKLSSNIKHKIDKTEITLGDK